MIDEKAGEESGKEEEERIESESQQESKPTVSTENSKPKLEPLENSEKIKVEEEEDVKDKKLTSIKEEVV